MLELASLNSVVDRLVRASWCMLEQQTIHDLTNEQNVHFEDINVECYFLQVIF